jgi:ectoine hydroxylase-related dioxygenase (phytanoyl-CoA dioxygenase family)
MITKQQREEFLELGFIKIDNVITAKELSWLRDRYDKMFVPSEENKIYQKQLGGTGNDGKNLLPQVLGVTNNFPEFGELEYRKTITEIAKFIHGDHSSFRNDHAILKPAGYGLVTPWHQDQAYHEAAYRFKTINFWLPLQDATVEGGCMWYVPYTHGGAVVPHSFLNEDDDETAMVADNQDYWHANGVAVPCEAGSVVLHHSYAMHYAGPNISEQPRRAYINVYEAEKKPLRNTLVFPWKKTQTNVS